MSIEQIFGLLSLLGAIITIVGVHHHRQGSKFKAVYERMEQIQTELQAYKLDVAERYASTKHLRDVETKILTAMDRITSRMDHMLDIVTKNLDGGK